ncbi:MAG: DUF7901 domain-containing protein, partial [Planctomycetota bacterium]
DFNGDGIWQAGDLAYSGFLPPGIHLVPVTVPFNAAIGQTFARCRISTAGVGSPVGPASDGEVEDHEVFIEAKRKWSQPADEIGPGVYRGWDELSWYNGPQIVADDWPCTDHRPVSDVHWWGSYQDWDDPGALPQVRPIGFHIGIWTDVPVGADDPFSHPKKMIWEYHAPIADVNEVFVGVDIYPGFLPDTCYRYDLQLPKTNWYWQDPNYAVHWISISAIYDDEADPGNNWGWKTRAWMWNDNAVTITNPTAPVINSSYITGSPIFDPCQEPNPMDMAFELTTHECYPSDDPHHQTWLNVGAPQCWCYQYNCKGDTDNIGAGGGSNKKYVVVADLNLLGAARAKKVTDPTLPANYQCANFDRLSAGSGVNKKYVVVGDLNILGTGWALKVTDPVFATNPCPGW